MYMDISYISTIYTDSKTDIYSIIREDLYRKVKYVIFL